MENSIQIKFSNKYKQTYFSLHVYQLVHGSEKWFISKSGRTIASISSFRTEEGRERKMDWRLARDNTRLLHIVEKRERRKPTSR